MKRKNCISRKTLIWLTLIFTIFAFFFSNTAFAKPVARETDKSVWIDATGRYINWDGVTNVAQFMSANGDICYAIDSGDNVEICKTRKGVPVSETVILAKQHPVFGTAICDGEGNYYLVTGEANETDDTSVETVFISKYDNEGNLIKTTGDNGSSSLAYYYDDSFFTKNPFDGGNCDAAISGDILTVNYARHMYSGHQSNSVFTVRTTDLSKVDMGTIYESHSFAQRVVPIRDGFVYMSEGDCYERGFTMFCSKQSNGKLSYQNEKKIFDFWVRDGAFDDYNMTLINNNFAHMGGMAALSDGYIAFASQSVSSLSQDAENESEEIFLQIFDPTQELNSAEGFRTVGERSGLAGNNGRTEVTNYGVKWLTSYGKKGAISNVQIVATDEDEIVILYELTDGNSYKGVYYMILDAEGNTLIPATQYSGNAMLNPCEMPVYSDNRVFWVGNRYKDKSNRIYVYSLATKEIPVKVDEQPAANEGLKYNGLSQELVKPGSATGGVIKYALGEQNAIEPDEDTYSAVVPKASDAGDYYVWCKPFAEEDGYTDGSATCIKVSISKAVPDYSVPDKLKAVYGQVLADLPLPEEWSWEDSSLEVGNVGENLFRAVYTPSDTTNYEKVEGVGISVDVTARDISEDVEIAEIKDQYWDGKPSEPVPEVILNGMKLKKDTDFTLSYTDNEGIGEAEVTIEGIGNFRGKKTISFRILKERYPYAVTVKIDNNIIKYGDTPIVSVEKNGNVPDETENFYYSESAVDGEKTLWDRRSLLNAGEWYFWAEIETERYETAKTERGKVTIEKIPHEQPAESVLPPQNEEGSFRILIELPDGLNQTDFEYVITSASVDSLKGDEEFTVLPEISSDSTFTVPRLLPKTEYKIWLRRRADKNHFASAAISRYFRTPEYRSGMDPEAIPTEDGSVYLVKGQTFEVGKDWRLTQKTNAVALKNGVVKAKKASNLPLEISNGSEKKQIFVSAPKISFKGGQKSAVLQLDGSIEASINGIPADWMSNYEVSWSSSNPSVILLDNNKGYDIKATAIGKGSSKITAYVGGKSYTIKATVKNTVNNIPKKVGTEANLTLDPTQSVFLKYSDFTAKNASWESAAGEDPLGDVQFDKKGAVTAKTNGIVLVNISNGMITAVGEGETTLEGTDTLGRSVTLHIAVKPLPSNSLIYIRQGKSVKLTAPRLSNKTANWEILSGSEYIQSVKNGFLKAAYSLPISDEKCCSEILCTYKPYDYGDGFTYHYNVYIEAPGLRTGASTNEGLQPVIKNGKIVSGQYELSLAPGDDFQLAEQYLNISQDIIWSSTKPTIAYVDEIGVLHVNRSGRKGKTVLKCNVGGVQLKVTLRVTNA